MNKRKKNKLRFLLFFFMSTTICLPGCSKKFDYYYPLKVGISKTLISSDGEMLHVSVNSVQSIDNVVYYTVRIFSEVGKSDTLFLRSEKNKILEYIDFANIQYPEEILPDSILLYFKERSQEQLRYDFDMKSGESIPVLIEEPKLKINTSPFYSVAIMMLKSKTDTVNIGETTYSDCYRFDYTFLNVDDANYSEWFAKNVGLVKIKYKISGKTFLLSN